MTTDEARAEKEEAEKLIKEILSDFMSKTGMTVENVRLTIVGHTPLGRRTQREIAAVELDVRL